MSDPADQTAGSTPTEAGETQRIAKRMARAGLCSRREAEKWIAEGRVSVNGVIIETPATLVGDNDAVTVDGKPLPAPDRPRLWRFNKPAGLLTTRSDPQGRPTVFDALPGDLPRLVSVGRLDINSEGLLLFTNDGGLARKLEHPSTGLRRRYRVRVRGRVEPDKLAALAEGVTVEGVQYGAVEARLENQQSSNAWVIVTLREGKNREVRRIMEHLGYPVNRLSRTAYGPITLLNLRRGEIEEVPPGIVRRLLGESHKGAKAKAKKVKPNRRKSRRAGAGGGAPRQGR
ncbi:MAG: pseudouridine synthase [Alphaproteobacteria bacterium]|nr:pseudouridine synthase [Alphaproteobacteria bacterium]